MVDQQLEQDSYTNTGCQYLKDEAPHKHLVYVWAFSSPDRKYVKENWTEGIFEVKFSKLNFGNADLDNTLCGLHCAFSYSILTTVLTD